MPRIFTIFIFLRWYWHGTHIASTCEMDGEKLIDRLLLIWHLRLYINFIFLHKPFCRLISYSDKRTKKKGSKFSYSIVVSIISPYCPSNKSEWEREEKHASQIFHWRNVNTTNKNTQILTKSTQINLEHIHNSKKFKSSQKWLILHQIKSYIWIERFA